MRHGRPHPRWTTAALLAALGVTLAIPPATAQDDPPPPAADPAPPAAEGDSGLFADPDDADTNDPAVPEGQRVDAEDLTLGETVELDSDLSRFRFHAEEPGILTLLTYAPNNSASLSLQLQDPDGRAVPGGVFHGNNVNQLGARIVVDARGNRQGVLPGFAYTTVVVTEPGEYQLQVSVDGEPEDRPSIGAAWMPFEQVGGFERQRPVAPPPPAVPPPPPVDPTEDAVELAVGAGLQLEVENGTGWVKLTAEDQGTLVFTTRAERGDVNLMLYAEDDLDNPQEYADYDRNGRPGHEALLFHADAGEVWYIQVSYGRGGEVPVYAGFVPDDLEAVDDPAEGDNAAEPDAAEE